jgi:hypothetical protein
MTAAMDFGFTHRDGSASGIAARALDALVHGWQVATPRAPIG